MMWQPSIHCCYSTYTIIAAVTCPYDSLYMLLLLMMMLMVMLSNPGRI